MDQNCLPHLPETLGQLEKLEFVSFAGNQIEEAYSAYFGPDGYA